MPYLILIPIHNEAGNLPVLLDELKPYAYDHELLLIDDGSTDTSNDLLAKCPFITLLHLENNAGKGLAIRKGIVKAKYDKIVITDGDLELETSELNKLMIIDKEPVWNALLVHGINILILSGHYGILAILS